MNKVQVKLTVLFDGVFWIGVFERVIDNKLEVAKVTFGAEPKDIEIYNFILNKYQYLKFSNGILINQKTQKEINPKRMKKLVKKQVGKSLGTKSQQALKLQQEQNKLNRKSISKQRKDELLKLKFEMKQKKRQQKHKGR
ncbi:MAG: YjdF family protein [bacterium]|nr:YjdF family protein [bacterium]